MLLMIRNWCLSCFHDMFASEGKPLATMQDDVQLDSKAATNCRKTQQQNTLTRLTFFPGSSYCGCSGSGGVSHPESLTVTLTADRGIGYGLTVSVGDHTENRSADILITRIAPNSPAYR